MSTNCSLSTFLRSSAGNIFVIQTNKGNNNYIIRPIFASGFERERFPRNTSQVLSMGLPATIKTSKGSISFSYFIEGLFSMLNPSKWKQYQAKRIDKADKLLMSDLR